jgi:cell division GTPase FtsZ
MTDVDIDSTRWSIIASGEGANRISFLYYALHKNPAIEDRVLLLNTTTADVKPEKTFEYMLNRDPNFAEVFDSVKRDKICIFGKSPSGAGNNWKVGENEAKEDFDTIRRYISNLRLSGRDVVFCITTLGGGTGNGSLPYLINRIKNERGLASVGENSFMALGIIPYDFEPAQRFFNAVCGMTRLLKYGEEGVQNADMLLLVDNSQVENLLGIKESTTTERYYRINEEIINVVDMMIAPGGKGAKSTIDVADYYQLPSNIGTYHFTPCMSVGNDPEIFGLDTALDTAIDRPMTPIDTKTATMAYIVAVAPQKYVEDGTFTQEDLEEIGRKWAMKNMAGSRGGILRYSSLISSTDTKTLDVMVLLGGFSLEKIISNALQKYYDFRESLEIKSGTAELADDVNPRIKVKINIKDIDTIEDRIKNYIALTEDKIKQLKKKEIDVDKELKAWGFNVRKRARK